MPEKNIQNIPTSVAAGAKHTVTGAALLVALTASLSFFSHASVSNATVVAQTSLNSNGLAVQRMTLSMSYRDALRIRPGERMELAFNRCPGTQDALAISVEDRSTDWRTSLRKSDRSGLVVAELPLSACGIGEQPKQAAVTTRESYLRLILESFIRR